VAALARKNLKMRYLDEAVVDDRRPDILLVDLPHSDVAPLEYRWRQCAVFKEVKKSA